MGGNGVARLHRQGPHLRPHLSLFTKQQNEVGSEAPAKGVRTGAALVRSTAGQGPAAGWSVTVHEVHENGTERLRLSAEGKRGGAGDEHARNGGAASGADATHPPAQTARPGRPERQSGTRPAGARPTASVWRQRAARLGQAPRTLLVRGRLFNVSMFIAAAVKQPAGAHTMHWWAARESALFPLAWMKEACRD